MTLLTSWERWKSWINKRITCNNLLYWNQWWTNYLGWLGTRHWEELHVNQFCDFSQFVSDMFGRLQSCAFGRYVFVIFCNGVELQNYPVHKEILTVLDTIWFTKRNPTVLLKNQSMTARTAVVLMYNKWLSKRSLICIARQMKWKQRSGGWRTEPSILKMSRWLA